VGGGGGVYLTPWTFWKGGGVVNAKVGTFTGGGKQRKNENNGKLHHHVQEWKPKTAKKELY